MAMSRFFGERSLKKVAAVFDQSDQARTVAELLLRDTGFSSQQVKLTGPSDTSIGRKLEPEDKGIFRTLVKSHVTLGLTGMVAGIVFAAVMIVAGIDFAVSSPYYTLFVAGIFGLFAGGMSGGLVTARPDHDLVIAKVKEAVRDGHWAVVVHPLSSDQERRAEDVLQRTGGDVVHTL